MRVAIVAITGPGVQQARDLGNALPESTVYCPERYARPNDEQVFTAPVVELLPELFAEYEGLICVMATGIVFRALAPFLRGKDVDPAVVVMDEKGQYAVSLLSGHLGGANDLARSAARASGGQAVITTATDVNRLPAWDDIARKEGLRVEPIKNIRKLNSLLLDKQNIVLVDRCKRISEYFSGVPGVGFFENIGEGMKVSAKGYVFVTHYNINQWQQRQDVLVLRPRDLVVGIGCNRDTTADEIESVVQEEFSRLHLSQHSIACIATIDAKNDEAGLLQFASRENLPIEFHSAAALNTIRVPSEPSPHAREAVGAQGVCEPAALLSAGCDRMLLGKQKRGNVTIAIAEKTVSIPDPL
ncbi:MAG: cobalt-precorrin 5A hydrolase [Desulfuromonas sp.]|nr:MAG: cobalt-precorrin 5A hydrolase [Desulfuromonas sp.]